MSKIDLKWETRFQELVEYKRIHGNCNVSTLDKANPHLGRWVHNQRTKEETISEERRKRLNSIGFTWKVHIFVDWEVRFQALVDYKRVNGNCNVPRVKKNESTSRDLGHDTTNNEGDNE